jgi:hypothetical protein
MSSAQKGSTKLSNPSLRRISKTAASLVDELFIAGAVQYTEKGLMEARLSIVGIRMLLKRLNCVDGAQVCGERIAHIDILLTNDNARAQVWQNIKEHRAEIGSPNEENETENEESTERVE